MPRYAVKIGEIHLVSDRPISMDERKEAIKQMAREGDFLLIVGHAELIAMPDEIPRDQK